MQNKVIDKVVFPNLNGLRFIAALTVIIHHIEEIKYWHRLNNLYFNHAFIRNMGPLGVTLFFVLSGFLITYLLLAEKESLGTISIKKFYIRRVLRIWPLYYLVVILAFFIFPLFHFFDIPTISGFLKDTMASNLTLFALILPNVAFVSVHWVAYASQAWSIGVEEQFYLMWPWLIKYFKNYVEILFFIIVLLILCRLGLVSDIIYQVNKVLHFSPDNSTELRDITLKIDLFFHYFRIGCMAIGGIGAYLLIYDKQEFLSLIFERKVQILSYIFVIYAVFRGLNVPDEFYSLFFIVIILNLAANRGSILKLEHTVLNYLGKISYGLYMLHFIAITLAIKSVQVYDKDINGILSNCLLYFLSVVYAVILASASFYLLENPFMKLKKAFIRIRSLGE